MSYLLIVLLVGLVILIHELGHLLAARWMGIPVTRFSVGYGPWFRPKYPEFLTTEAKAHRAKEQEVRYEPRKCSRKDIDSLCLFGPFISYLH